MARRSMVRLEEVGDAPLAAPPGKDDGGLLSLGDTVILTESGSNGSKPTMQIPKERQPTVVTGSVQ